MRVAQAPPYEVRQSRLRTALRLALYSLLPVLFMAVGLWDLSERYPFFLAGLAFGAVIAALMFKRIRSAVHREPLFVIDEQGVHLGPDAFGRPAKHEPWPGIEFVVHFTGMERMTDIELRNHRYVGVVRGGRVVTFRAVSGWRLNVNRAAAAVDRFGGGASFAEAPAHSEVPNKWYFPLALPPGWLAAHSQPDDRRPPPAVPGTAR
ncbi:hypothetical protein [Micromonospora endophytica]|uniref:hypothetical protein n=1 Tax=Micromonospora endophytica TaxID=515350 RepID=UPI0011B73515|nr:hypothetical protein [Micromonospora endophytica]